MCLLTLRSLTTKDGQTQQDDRPTSCNDGSQDLNNQHFFPIIEEDKDEKKTDTSFNPGRSLNEDAVVNEYWSSEPTPVDDKMKKHGLRNITSEMARDYRIVDPKTRVHKGKRRKIKNNSKPRDMIKHLLSCEPLFTIFEIWKKENMRQLFLMLFLIILLKNTCENIKCKQSSCRKYPCLNSILYLLWQSGDVEVNPGPPAKSTTYRNWLYDVCSIVRKAVAGVSTDCKMNKIWQQKPKNWPPEEPYFNPRVKGVNEVEDLLINLLHCRDDTSKLPPDIKSEIDTWNDPRRKDIDELLHLYRTRKCCMSIEQVNRSLKVLQSHLSAYDSLIIEGNTCIRISLSFQPARDQQVITHKIYRSVATRKMSSFLCRILHGKDPEVKCDDIWTLTPDGWPSCLRYYNPNNGGERCAEDEDGMVVEALITLCEKKSIILPKSYEDMVDAWQADDQKLLSKLLTRHTAETDLKKAVMKLHKEGLLKDVDEHLRELGLLIQCEMKAQKRKMANTINKHETKRTKQRDNEGAVDTTPTELFPDCFLGELLRNNSQDDSLPDMICKYLPDSLNGAFDDIQC